VKVNGLKVPRVALPQRLARIGLSHRLSHAYHHQYTPAEVIWLSTTSITNC
jgi:hypothetical protein